MAGLLDGVRVLGLSAVIAGPLYSYQLTRLGAEIIEIEPPSNLGQRSGDILASLGYTPDAIAELCRGGAI